MYRSGSQQTARYQLCKLLMCGRRSVPRSKSCISKRGQFVRKGDRLFTLDTRTEDANLSKAEAQVVKDRADLMNAERNLERERGC